MGTAKSEFVSIRTPELASGEITIVGNQPLLVCRYHKDEDPNVRNKGAEEYLLCTYPLNKEWTLFGFPSSGIKSSWRNTANTHIKNQVTKVAFDGLIYMTDILCPIISTALPAHYESYVRTSRGDMVKGIKAQFWPWSITVKYSYMPGMISAEQIMNIASFAGVTQGLGCRSPHWKGGTYGTYNLKLDQ